MQESILKDIKNLPNDLEKLKSKLIENIKEAHRQTAEEMWQDVINNAPMNMGDYISSITLQTEDDGTKIVSTVSSDLIVGPSISTGKSYNLGFLLETGTEPHAIPNAFNWGVIYGYDSDMYKRTLSPDWHPGTVAQPHYNPALLKAKEKQKIAIKKAIKEAIK